MALIDNLVSYWKLDEASGNALDAHGSNHLTETSGTIDAATGKINGGRDLEAGGTHYFEGADNADFSTGDIDFTWALWWKPESTGTMTIIGKLNTASNLEYSLHHQTFFRFGASSNGTNLATAISSVAASADTWYFLVGWHDSVNNVIAISVNNGTPATTAHTGGVFDGTSPLRFGQSNAFGSADGVLDEVGFWKRVLTSDERTALYNSGSGFAYPFDTGGGAALSSYPYAICI